MRHEPTPSVHCPLDECHLSQCDTVTANLVQVEWRVEQAVLLLLLLLCTRVPAGAYTSICSSKHVPQYMERAQELREQGVQVIACLSVNGEPGWGFGR